MPLARRTKSALLRPSMGSRWWQAANLGALRHVEHHDFPELPMYRLPQLRLMAPESYDTLRTMPLLHWRTVRALSAA